jgi:hypothetical protein
MVNVAPTSETRRNQAELLTGQRYAEWGSDAETGARVLGITTRAPYHAGFPTASQSPLRRSDAAAHGS